MSNFKVVDPTIGAPGPVSATGTVQLFPLGYFIHGQDLGSGKSSANVGAGEFVYAQGSNVTAAGQFVHISNNSAVLLASANSASFFPIGVAAGNLSASNVFGWVQVGGVCDYAVGGTNSSIAAGAALYLCGTAGILHTGAVAGQHVQGVVAPVSWTSAQTGAFTVQLFRPFIAGLSAAL